MRIPLLPTLFVSAAVAVMIGLGFWQLERREWKEALIAEAAQRGLTPTLLDCSIDAVATVRAGRSRAGESGYRYIVPCEGPAGFSVDIGWAKRPDLLRRVVHAAPIAAVPELGNDVLFVAVEPVPPLAASRLPSVEDIPNNHLFYAVQWFFFAAAAAVIYVLALRRRRKGG